MERCIQENLIDLHANVAFPKEDLEKDSDRFIDKLHIEDHARNLIASSAHMCNMAVG